MSISEELAEKLLVIANNIATESEAVEQQTELLQQIRTALVGKTVPGNPGDSGSYDEGYADGQQDVLDAVNYELAGRGLEELNSADEIPHKLDEAFLTLEGNGYESGKTRAEANAIALVNEGLTLSDLAVAEVNSLEEIPEKIDEVYLYGTEEGYESGKKSAIESLPGGYVKIDPTWTSFDNFCMARPSMVGHLKYSDTANGVRFSSMFNNCQVKSIPSLDLRKGTHFGSMFIYSSSIEEIGEMDISNAVDVTYMFLSCSGLKRISFVPGCIKLSLNFAQSSLLDDASIQSIIDGLADLTGKTAQTLTLHATVGGKLTQAQKDAATAKNWTLAY